MCLLIDEEGRGRHHLGEMLSGLGFEMSLTSGADEAMRVCNDNPPDVVMLSARANGGAPKDFVKRLRMAARGKPPVVFLFAETPDTGLFGQTILEGAADVLMMPLDRDLLHFKLRQAGIAV
jgi:DNA-binding response OmpR family regulator